MSEYNTVSGPVPSTKPVQQEAIEEAEEPVYVLHSSLVTSEFGSPMLTSTPPSTSTHHFISHQQQHRNSCSRPTLSPRAATTVSLSPGRSSSIHGILQKLHCFFSPRKLSRSRSSEKKPQRVDGPERVPPSTPPSASHVNVVETGTVATPRRRSGQEDEYLEKVFRYFDENGDGKISPSELRSYMRTVGEELSAEDAEAVVESTDSDGDGLLALDDFVKLVDGGGEQERTRDLREAFRMYEVEGHGCITPKSLRRMLRRLGDTDTTVEQCKVMIRRFDLDGDGVLSFDEFKLMML